MLQGERELRQRSILLRTKRDFPLNASIGGHVSQELLRQQINYPSACMEVRGDHNSSDPTFDAFEQIRCQRAKIKAVRLPRFRLFQIDSLETVL